MSLFSNIKIGYSGFSNLYFGIICLFSIAFAIQVINRKNPILSVLFLIGLFITISVNLILLGYNFIGLSYLLVYVGAISILFLFILMLINIRISELLNDTNNYIPLAIFTSISLGFPLYKTLNERSFDEVSKQSGSELDISNIFINIIDCCQSIINILCNLDNYCFMLFKNWDSFLSEYTDISSVGNILYSVVGIWLIICSIVLILAMVGAITITKNENESFSISEITSIHNSLLSINSFNKLGERDRTLSTKGKIS